MHVRFLIWIPEPELYLSRLTESTVLVTNISVDAFLDFTTIQVMIKNITQCFIGRLIHDLLLYLFSSDYRVLQAPRNPYRNHTCSTIKSQGIPYLVRRAFLYPCPEAISHLCQSASSQSQIFPQHQHINIPAHQIPMHITLNNKSLFAAQILNTPSSRIPHMNEANTNSPLKNVSFASKSRTNYNDTSPN